MKTKYVSNPDLSNVFRTDTVPFLVEELVLRSMNCYAVTIWTSGISRVVSVTGHSKRLGTARELLLGEMCYSLEAKRLVGG
jgi:hypothetical protein